MKLGHGSACLFVVVAATAQAAAPASSIRLAGHRAVYDLSLGQSAGTRAVESARGRIVIDFTGDACKGYTMTTRQVTELQSSESGSRTSDLRNTTFESGDGRSFRFKTTTALNGTQNQAVDGTAEIGGDALKVRLKEPKRDQFEGSAGVMFPSLHMRRLIEAARAGETTVSVQVFDGSDDGRKIYDTLAVIGRRTVAPVAGTERDKPLQAGDMAAMPRWPVTLSYFTAGAGERTPIYTLAFDLYDNGVSGRLRLDYGDFAIVGDLSRLDMLPAGQDCRQ
ncbi:MAG TPA: cell envelope integrity EipB family protein [Methylobacterium sp.]|jgi:hypothetical protein